MFDGAFAEFVIQLIGPTLALAIAGAMIAVVRTRTNTQRIEVLEADMNKLETLPTDIAALRASVEARLFSDNESFKRNDFDHNEIKRALVENRKEFKELRTELLGEIRRMNGHVQEVKATTG